MSAERGPGPRGQPGDQVSDRWARWRSSIDLEEYYTRWRRLAQSGRSPHGEADLVESFHPSTVLDAGCGMGRVTIELARRGVDVVGADLDGDLLQYARRSEPSLEWVHDDLSSMHLGRRFELIVMAGNVMVFCRPSDRSAIIRNLAAHVEPEGRLVAGFDLEHGQEALSLVDYDAMCAAAGLGLAERWATWEREPYRGGGYAVSVHRRQAGG